MAKTSHIEELAQIRKQLKRTQAWLTILIIFVLLLGAGFFVLRNQRRDQGLEYVRIPGLTGSQGPKGDTGDIGPQGVQGPIGLQGPIGPRGLQGETGPRGTQGIQGDQGPIGPQGNPGTNGTDGADGREVELRCNTETQEFEQRYEGDEIWEPIEGSDCIADEEPDEPPTP